MFPEILFSRMVPCIVPVISLKMLADIDSFRDEYSAKHFLLRVHRYIRSKQCLIQIHRTDGKLREGTHVNRKVSLRCHVSGILIVRVEPLANQFDMVGKYTVGTVIFRDYLIRDFDCKIAIHGLFNRLEKLLRIDDPHHKVRASGVSTIRRRSIPSGRFISIVP